MAEHPEVARLADRFIREPNSGCWIWMLALDCGGYGAIRREGRAQKAHRYLYEKVRGPLQDGLQLDHLCRVRCCVNPAHLEPVTHKENMRRAIGTADKLRKAQTHCKRGHEYTPENTYTRPNGNRYCRACHVAEVRAHGCRYR